MRKSMISAPVFQRSFRKGDAAPYRVLKEAIDAGTTVGRRPVRVIRTGKSQHNYPQPRLTAEEQAFIDGPVEEACRMANDFAITR